MTTAAAEDRERVGPYQIVQAIGAGGSARIDLARIDRAYGFQRHVVIKRPLEHLRGNAQVAASLRREARIGGLLRHPNLVAVLDAGAHDGYDYLVLEYVHGSSLRALMQTETPGEVRELPLAVALAIATDVARAMHEAHELTDETGAPLGLVHRDVSPGNILLGLDGTVKLADFGIAKETRVSTLSGSMHGTVTYMAPEQCQGHAFDRRADVFSLGVILYELVTGVRLFWADNDVASLHRVLSGAVPRPRTVKPQLPTALEDIVLTAVAHEADQRYSSALELATALELYAAGAGEILGARWIARAMEDVVGARPVPWIAGPTLQDVALPTIPETAAPTIPDLAPRDEGSLVALISAVAPDDPVEPFGPDDDLAAVAEEPSPSQRRAPSPAAESAPAPAPSPAPAASTEPGWPSNRAPPSSSAPSNRATSSAAAAAAPSARRGRALMAAVVVLGLGGGSAVTALFMTRGTSAPATTVAPRATSPEPAAGASGNAQGSTPSSSGQPLANGSAPAPDVATTGAAAVADPAAPARGDTPAADRTAPSSRPDPATAPTASTGDRREATAPGMQPPVGGAASVVRGGATAPSPPTTLRPSVVPSPTPTRNKRRKPPAPRSTPRDTDPRSGEQAASPAPAENATTPPASPPPPAAPPPAVPPAKVEWKPTMLLPTDGSGARAPK